VRLRAVVVAVLGLALPGIAASQALAGVANRGVSRAPASNPLAGLPLGNYTGSGDEVFPAYDSASGSRRSLLAKIALTPRMRWFGIWDADPEQTAADYIANVTGGNPALLAQMAVFRLQPWENEATRRLPTAAEQAAYRSWIDAFAAGIGPARVALVLQPDLPFALSVPHHSTLPLRQIAYAARRFSVLPHTTVYIDVGASDWPTVAQAVSLLRGAGVRYTRGFALGATHYATTADEVRFGARVIGALSRDGIRGMHFVVNTAQNGAGFTYQQYNHPSSFDNATVCRHRGQSRCVTLGVPPTTDVANRHWRLPPSVRRLAARYEDADLWIGRPWLDNQNDPFDLARSLALARSAPF
jgi:endoglucanase